MSFIPRQIIQNLFEQLNSSDIEYVLIKNISDELPEKLKDGKDIDILVHESNIKKFEKFMKTHNFKKRVHPYGRRKEWSFAYKLPEHQFWQFNDNNFTLYIDVSFKLCCRSLTPKVWIPLDNCINEDIWKNKIFDKKNKWWILNEENLLVYLICRSVFDKKEFRLDYITEIEKRKSLLKQKSVRLKISKVFFKYTDSLILQIEDSNYENIISNYLSFKNY